MVLGCSGRASETPANETPASETPASEAPSVTTPTPSRQLDPCNCAQSDGLRALSCGPDAASWLHLTPAGDAILYTVNLDTYLWKLDAGLELLKAQSEALAFSDDGQTALIGAIGSSDLLVWHADGANDVYGSMTGFGMSADGEVVLAWDYSSAPRSVLLRRERGAIGISDASTPGVRCDPALIARDGTAAIGTCVKDEPQLARGYVELPLLWTELEGARALGPLPPGARNGYAGAVSRGGAAVSGWLGDDADTSLGTYRWTPLDGMRLVIPGPTRWNRTLISADGAIVIATQLEERTELTRVARWTEATGVTRLDSASRRSTIPDAMTPDGGTLLGHITPYARGIYSQSPFVWREDLGLVDLAEALADSGVELDGWQLGWAGAISADGRVIIGNGSCGGTPSVYRLTLPW